jgi:hypothetical protein
MVAGFRLHEAMPQVRVMVARHRAPELGKKVSVGKCIGEWVYEVFITTSPTDGFLVEDVLNPYHGRGAFEGVLADEDVEADPDRWCSYTECGQELWQITWKSGVESAASAWARDANGHETRDPLGCRQRSSFCFRSSGKHTRRVRPVAVGKTVWRSNGALRGGVLYSARQWDAALRSREQV